MKLFTVAVSLFVVIYLDSAPSVSARTLSKADACYISYVTLVGRKNAKNHVYFCDGEHAMLNTTV